MPAGVWTWRDGSGVCLLYKRWDDDVAALPEIPDGAKRVVMELSALARLLDGAPMKTAAQMEPTKKAVAHAAKAAAKKWVKKP